MDVKYPPKLDQILEIQNLISGKYWRECEYLVESYEECSRKAKEDEELGFSYFPGLQSCLQAKIKDWTWVKEERESILTEILEDDPDVT